MDLNNCNWTRNLLCNVCGLYTPKNKQRPFTELVVEKFIFHFQRKPQIDEVFAPSRLCLCCHSMLLKNDCMKRSILAVPMIWVAPDVAHLYCYSCLMPSLVGKKWSDRKQIEYPKTSWSFFPENFATDDQMDVAEEDMPITESAPSLDVGSSYDPQASTSTGHPYNQNLVGQASFNDLTRDLRLPNDLSELLGSRLREKGLLKQGTKTSSRNRCDEFRSMFDETNGITYLRNLHGLFELFEVQHEPDQWRLFIDGNVSSLKALLLHNGNIYPSIPIAYSNMHKEEYIVLKDILFLINYPEFQWKIIADFKLINIIMGLKKGNPKFPCFICLWDRNTKEDEYSALDWPPRPAYDKYPKGNQSYYSAEFQPLVMPENILHPPLHIKLGLVTQLFKKLVQNNEKAMERIKELFPKLSDMKVKMGIFDGPKIREIFNKSTIEDILDIDERLAYENLKLVCSGFLGNHRADNYKELIDNMMTSYKRLGIKVTLKMHSLISHLERFPSNLGSFSDEQGERAHQDLMNIEKRFKGKSNVNALGTYCWELVRQVDPDTHFRHSRSKTKFFNVKYL